MSRSVSAIMSDSSQSSLPLQIVDEGSARLDQQHEDVIPLAANHLGICKFKDAQDNKYITARMRLQAEISGIVEQPLNIRDQQMADFLKYVTPTHDPSRSQDSQGTGA